MEAEGSWPEAAAGSLLDAFGTASVEGGDVSSRTSAELGEIAMDKAIPDLALPAAVVVFDSGLEAGFPRGCKDGSDLELQAEADDAAESIGVLMRALKEGVVIELSVGRQAMLAPVIGEIGEDEIGAQTGMGPGAGQATVQRDGIEDFDALAAGDDETFDAIEAVEFGLAGGDARQIPTRARSWPAAACLSVEDAGALENAADGADGRDRCRGSSLLQSAMDGFCTDFAQRAFGQLLADFENSALQCGWSSIGANLRSAATSGTIGHRGQRRLSRASEPILDCGQTEAKAVSHGALGKPAGHGLQQSEAALGRKVFIRPAKQAAAVGGGAIFGFGRLRCRLATLAAQLHLPNPKIIPLALAWLTYNCWHQADLQIVALGR